MTFSDLQRFTVSVADSVAVVKINNPPVNAQDRQFRLEIVDLFDRLGQADDINAIILTGEGRAFSAGADLKERKDVPTWPGGYPAHNRLVRAAFDAITDCSKPVIAGVNGAAIGAGCVLALLCDILLVSEDSFFAMTEVEYGLAGGVRHVMRSFGSSDARLMILTAKRISGPELLRMNVASACVRADELLPECLSIARSIASKAPLAVEAAKRSFGLTEDMTLREGYRYEQTQTAALSSTEDTREALAAFAEKRRPVFRRR